MKTAEVFNCFKLQTNCFDIPGTNSFLIENILHFMIVKCCEVKSMFMPFMLHLSSPPHARTHCEKSCDQKAGIFRLAQRKKRRQVSHRRARCSFLRWKRAADALSHSESNAFNTRSSSSLALSALKCVFVCCASERAFKFVLFILTNKQGPRARTMQKKDAQPLIGHNGPPVLLFTSWLMCA